MPSIARRLIERIVEFLGSAVDSYLLQMDPNIGQWLGRQYSQWAIVGLIHAVVVSLARHSHRCYEHN